MNSGVQLSYRCCNKGLKHVMYRACCKVAAAEATAAAAGLAPFWRERWGVDNDAGGWFVLKLSSLMAPAAAPRRLHACVHT
jgi:hypothetical protein